MKASAMRIPPALALAAIGALQWSEQLTPRRSGGLLAAAAVGALAALAIAFALRLPRPARGAAVGVLLAVAAAGVVVCSGIDPALLAPGRLGALRSGIADGIANLPGTPIPYRGLDEWTRHVLSLSGALLLAGGVLAACAPGRSRRRDVLALCLLFAAVAIPEANLHPEHAYARGALVFLAAAALLWSGRVRTVHAPSAAGLVAAGALVAVVAAPLADRERALVDYESAARSIDPARHGARFDWRQGYGAIDWPRDGRTVLRISTRRRGYWTATHLDSFDGRRWVQDPSPRRTASSGSELPDGIGRHDAGYERLRVRVRDLRSSEVVGTGTTLAVLGLGAATRVGPSPGTVLADRPLRVGDSYTALAWAPDPSARVLRAAGTAYPSWTDDYLVVGLPRPARLPGEAIGDAPQAAIFHAFPSTAPPLVRTAIGNVLPGARSLAASPYGRTWALARSLRARTSTPYGFARTIERHLAGPGFAYDERPPASAVPLDTFLFAGGRGYCQHFAGAMALLLRMGGVPARVVAGFAPGTYDRDRRQWVVRDLDAHAWVEAWFPGHGWVTFDPTPAASPASTPADDVAVRTPGAPGDVQRGRRPERPIDLGHGGGLPSERRGGWLVLAGLALLAALALGGARLRSRDQSGPATELERALRRSGRSPAPGTTLRSLERELGLSGPAAEYLRALEHVRYAGHGSPPTRAQRRALRDALVRGLGPLSGVRGWWVLPPWTRIGRVPSGPADPT